MVGTAVAAFLVARASDLSPTPLLPPGSTGIIVLDLSISVENSTLDRMYTGLTQLAATHDRFGLVLFSSRAYEALPPDTPASELSPFARFFRKASPTPGGQLPNGAQGQFNGGGGGQFNGGGGQNQPEGYPRNPWACCFSFGTEVSDGLGLAQTIILAKHISRPTVWLMSDLADDPADRAAVARIAKSYIHLGIALRVIGLNPKRADEAFFEGLLGPRGTLIVAKPSTQVRLSTRHRFPVGLGIAAVVLALLLAANELLSTPFRWGAERASAGVISG